LISKILARHFLSDLALAGCLINEMQNPSDAKLLAEYAQGRSEDAFSEIVTRHADLVYSTALRHINSTDLASEVTQTVFIDLARKSPELAGKLAPNASLVGWLYRCTRYASLNLMRAEHRRQAKERQAMQDAPNPSTPVETSADWEQLRPLLDTAMSDLEDEDREALLLRFFKNQDFRAVGLAMGISDDAAQKRVSRAIEKLRRICTHNGVTTSGATLGLVISAHAVQGAPAGLAAGISKMAALGGAALHTSLIVETKAIAMTTMQKVFVSVTVAVLAGTGLYEAGRASRLNSQLSRMQEQQAPLEAQIDQLRQERDEAAERLNTLRTEATGQSAISNELLRLRGEVSRLRSQNAALSQTQKNPVEASAQLWADRVTQLKQRLQQTPGAAIPEFAYLEEAHWLNAAREPLVDEKDYRRAFAALRAAGENQFIIKMQKALQNFMKQSNGEFPSDVAQLRPYFETAPEEAALQRYAVVAASSIPNLKMGGDSVIAVKNPLDEEYDSIWALGPNGFGTSSARGANAGRILAPALEAYKAANNGEEPKNPPDLLPYLSTPEQQAAYQKLEELRKH
jgi:RNA polymerase sigma factor (sigma-70 family)